MRAFIASMAVLVLWPATGFGIQPRVKPVDAEGNCPGGYEKRPGRAVWCRKAPCPEPRPFCVPAKKPTTVSEPRPVRGKCPAGYERYEFRKPMGFTGLPVYRCRPVKPSGGDLTGLRNEVRSLSTQVRKLHQEIAALKKANQDLAAKVEALEGRGAATSQEEPPPEGAPSEIVE